MGKEFFLYPFQAGQAVTLHKAHPCGGKTWKLLRVAGDVTLECLTCGRKMILSRSALEKACSRIEPASEPQEDRNGKV